MLLALYNDVPSSSSSFEAIREANLIQRLKALDSRARRKGLDSIEADKNPLIRLGMEINGDGRVTKNSYGVFNLSWQAETHPQWPREIASEVENIRRAIRSTHRTTLKFLIWAGMGGSAEDKATYIATGLIGSKPRCYILDSTDPAKLKAILSDMKTRSGLSLPDILRSTLVVGMAMGMTSYEPVVNLEKLSLLYERNGVNSRTNFIYMTLPDSLLDRFAKARGYQRIELQPDSANTTAGRHSSPLTRGSLYPLALAGVDLDQWIGGTFLDENDLDASFQLGSFLHAHGKEGRDKVTLLLPKDWRGAALWTKQDFEESLGKREDLGIKIIIGEKVKLANYRSPKDHAQDRVFLAVTFKGSRGEELQKASLLRRSGYPVAVISAPRDTVLSHYMQFIHYTVFAVAWHRKINFVTQPSVELYKSITNRLHDEAQKAGGITKTREWQRSQNAAQQARWRAVTLHYDRLTLTSNPATNNAPALYASFLRTLCSTNRIDYAELTFFGDTRYSAPGRALRKRLERCAELVFRNRLKMPVDIYEGPAMNHSYHEMIIGRGRCFSTVLVSEKADSLPAADYTADYHQAQFLATQMALAERGRPVVAITLRDLEDASQASLEAFFRQVAVELKTSAKALIAQA